jgi:hypothetical protein
VIYNEIGSQVQAKNQTPLLRSLVYFSIFFLQ